MEQPNTITVSPDTRLAVLEDQYAGACIERVRLQAVIVTLENQLDAALERIAIMEVEADIDGAPV